ncbi:MAG: hypothetical protein IPK72_04555 [Candidatus Eisenbacteria bacterium]|nr:hypothetical protein [Candidatus Eisenbacteria bacterium]
MEHRTGKVDRSHLPALSPARLEPGRARPEMEPETVRLRHDLAQRESLALLLEGLLESVADGVIALDFRGEIAHLSDALRDPGREEPIPEGILELLRERAATVRSRPERFEFDWDREDFGLRRYRAVAARGTSGIVLFALHDVTHERTMRAELEQAQNLAALGQMAATVAHELRNPLAAIQGFAGLVQREVSDRPAALRQIDRIFEGVQRANHIIGDLLEYSKPMELHRQATSVESLLVESLTHEKACPRWDDRFAADLAVDPGLPLIAVDRRLLIQVLTNLYDNALDAMGEGGTLSVRARASSDIKPCPRIRIVVRDTGCGLSADEAARVFEPFYTTKPRGTGLGLALVRRAVEAHGGRVHVVSAPGRGTSVVVDLPVGGVRHGDVLPEIEQRMQEAA